LENKTCR